MAFDWSSLIGNTVRVFVPSIGMVEGAIQMVQTGSPAGAAKILVPGIGMIDAAFDVGSQTWTATGGAVAENVKGATGGLVVALALAGIALLILTRK